MAKKTLKKMASGHSNKSAIYAAAGANMQSKGKLWKSKDGKRTKSAGKVKKSGGLKKKSGKQKVVENAEYLKRAKAGKGRANELKKIRLDIIKKKGEKAMFGKPANLAWTRENGLSLKSLNKINQGEKGGDFKKTEKNVFKDSAGNTVKLSGKSGSYYGTVTNKKGLVIAHNSSNSSSSQKKELSKATDFLSKHSLNLNREEINKIGKRKGAKIQKALRMSGL